MYGLSEYGENIFDLRWPLKVKGKGQTPKNWGTLLFQSTIDVHIQNPHKNSGWSLAWLHWLLQCALWCYQTAQGSHSVRLCRLLHLQRNTVQSVLKNLWIKIIGLSPTFQNPNSDRSTHRHFPHARYTLGTYQRAPTPPHKLEATVQIEWIRFISIRPIT